MIDARVMCARAGSEMIPKRPGLSKHLSEVGYGSGAGLATPFGIKELLSKTMSEDESLEIWIIPQDRQILVMLSAHSQVRLNVQGFLQ